MSSLIPQGLPVAALQTFMERTHQTHFTVRVVSAFIFAFLVALIGGFAWAPGALVWFLGVILAEKWTKQRISACESALNETPNAADAVTAELFRLTGALTLLWSVPGLALLWAPHPGAVISLLLFASVLMNVAGQHVLHPRMVAWSAPAPCVGLVVGAYQLGGSEHGWLCAAIASLVVLQVLSLTRAATDSYASLVAAIDEARAQGLARERADAANSAKSQFMANMSHELRTPLNAIIGYSEIMRESASDDTRTHDMADHDRVLGAARRLLRLVDEVLDLSKVEAGGMTIERAPFDVARVLMEAADHVRPQASANGNQVLVRVADDIGVVCSDGHRFGQCVLNLLSNAAKFTREGAITLQARRVARGGKSFVEVDVIDTGIGLSADQRAIIFEPFRQADESITRKFGGAGLGLALTRELARLMGGDVTVDSTLGAGARFTLSIRDDAFEAPVAKVA